VKLQSLKPRIATLKPRITESTGSWRDDKQGSTSRLYTYKWQKASKDFLAKHPLCSCPDCDEGRKRVTLATVVDHHIPHRGDFERFWDRSNWRAMAKPCHDAKTQRETAAGL